MKINYCLDCKKSIDRRAKRCYSCATKEKHRIGTLNNKGKNNGMFGKKGYWKKKKRLDISGKNNPNFNLREQHPTYKTGRKITKDGYILIKTYDYPYRNYQNYILEHRLVMEKYLGRYLKPEEIVHHKNGIRGDNRVENLKLFKNNRKHLDIEHPAIRNRKGQFMNKEELK